MMDAFLRNALSNLEDQGLLRTLKTRTGPSARHVIVNGQNLLNFSSNDYLGLAADKRLSQAASQALDQNGFGSSASRLIVGNMQATEQLEARLATLKSLDDGLIFNSGYAANTGIIQALVGRDDVVLSDRFNHASIIDGIILSRARMKRYAHLDMNMLEAMLKQSAAFRKRLIVTDSVFSMDGDVAPLGHIVLLAKKYDAWLMVDDAHGFGVFGTNGAGMTNEMCDAKDIDIHMGTLSKAAGCFGAYVCGAAPLKSFLINHARSFIYSTALPAAVIAAAHQAVDIIASSEGDERRHRVLANADYVRKQLIDLGFETLNSRTPIIPIVLKSSQKAVAVSQFLYNQGILVNAIRPPTVPINTARLRIAVTANHTQEDLETLMGALKKA